MIEITPLREDDRPAWQPLAVGYNAFYERVLPDADYDRVWRRLMEAEELHGLARAARRPRRRHRPLFLPSPASGSTMSATSPTCSSTRQVRGQGAARLLIEAVADEARARGCPRYYWLTQQHNVRARGLYDKVARFAGFIRYDYPMNPP